VTCRRFVLAATWVAAVVGAAGCGGDDEPELYRLEPTRACLTSENVVVSQRDLDFVASTALGGGLRARLGRNEVVLAFAEDEEDGAAIEQAYRRFAGENIGLSDVLMRDRNVVLVWAGKPSEQDLDRITSCLKGSD
jgi:hypothetical protein